MKNWGRSKTLTSDLSWIVFLLNTMLHITTSSPRDITPAGADSVCNTGCSWSTRRMMRQWNQCSMRELRQRSTTYRAMSDDSFVTMLSQARDGCAVDDCCMTEDDARSNMLRCVREETAGGPKSSNSRTRNRRSAVIYPVHLQPVLNKWTSPINFAFSEDFSESQKAAIRQVITFFESNTCLEFTERSPTETFSGALFIRNDTGCYSYVGKVFTEKQPINLQASVGCITFSTIAHEVMHFLGIPHEQSRDDRDDHVTILFDNIAGTEYVINFQKESFTWLVTEYDYTSVMHYRKNAFGRNGRATLATKDAAFSYAVGQREEVSFHDLRTVNELYCRDTCSTSSLQCQHGGYPNPSDCSQCHCPVTYSGPDGECNALPQSNELICGIDQIRELSVNGQTSTTISKTNFLDLTFLCVWKIMAPEGYSMVVNSNSFSTGTGLNYCQSHWVEIFPDGETFQVVPRYCSTRGPSDVIIDTSSILIVYRSYESHGGSVDGIELIVSLDLNECLDGSANCDSNADCVNTVGSYRCECREGFSGDGVTDCTDIDECTMTDICGDNAMCIDTEGSFSCVCDDGYCHSGGICISCPEAQVQDSLVLMHNSLRRQIAASDMVELVGDESLRRQIETLNAPCPAFVAGGPEDSEWWDATRYSSDSLASVQDFNLTEILMEAYEGTTYDPNMNTCSGECDIYRRMFYKNFIRMACGAVICRSDTEFFQVQEPSRSEGAFLVLVCSYLPALQPSVKLYTPGTPCTTCPPYRPTCTDNLCSAPPADSASDPGTQTSSTPSAETTLSTTTPMDTSTTTRTTTTTETSSTQLTTTSSPIPTTSVTTTTTENEISSTTTATTVDASDLTTEPSTTIPPPPTTSSTTTIAAPITPPTMLDAAPSSLGAIIGGAVGGVAFFIILGVIIGVAICQQSVRRPTLPVTQYTNRAPPYFNTRPAVMPQTNGQMMFVRNNNYFAGQPRQVMSI